MCLCIIAGSVANGRGSVDGSQIDLNGGRMAYLGIQSVHLGKTSECIEKCFQVVFPDAYIIVDATYGKGRFWDWKHSLEVHGVDIAPRHEDVLQADYRSLPFATGACDVLCWDPVFIFTPGIRRTMGTTRLFTNNETGESARLLDKPRNPADLLLHAQRIFEQAKVMSRIGLLIKGQDLVVNQSDWWLHNLMSLGEKCGVGLPYDILIQVSPSHRMIDKRWKNQYHFRRAHAFYVCYRWDRGKALHKRNETCTATMAT